MSTVVPAVQRKLRSHISSRRPSTSTCSLALVSATEQEEHGGQRSSSSTGSDSVQAEVKAAHNTRSKYRGVSRSTADHKWRVRVHLYGKQIHIGRCVHKRFFCSARSVSEVCKCVLLLHHGFRYTIWLLLPCLMLVSQ